MFCKGGVKVLVKWKDFFLFFGSGGCLGKGFCEWRDSFCFGKVELLWQRFLWSEESFLCFGKRYILCKDSSGIEDFFSFGGDTCWVEVLADRLFFCFEKGCLVL